jgi:hypothetical protein
MAEAMRVSLKTENEEYAGKTMQIRAAKAGGEVSPARARRDLAGEFAGSPPAWKPDGLEGPPPASPMA